MKKIIFLLFFLIFENLCFASYYKVHLYTNEKRIYLGQKVKFFLSISSDQEIKDIKINFPKEYKNYYPSNPVILEKSKKHLIYFFYMQFFRTGRLVISPIEIKINGIRVKSNELILNILSNLKPNTKFKDIKSPEKVNFYLTKTEKLIILGLLILLFLMLFVMIKLLGKRNRSKKRENFLVNDYKLPIEEALENIKKCENLLNDLKIKQMYFCMSYTLRRFIDRKFRLNTLELTTDEIRKKYNINLSILETLEKWDSVKFTDKIPSKYVAEEDLNKLKEIIEKIERK